MMTSMEKGPTFIAWVYVYRSIIDYGMASVTFLYQAINQLKYFGYHSGGKGKAVHSQLSHSHLRAKRLP